MEGDGFGVAGLQWIGKGEGWTDSQTARRQTLAVSSISALSHIRYINRSLT